MDKKIKPPDNQFRIRCPRLGHMINFKYCKTENNNQPCFKTLDCWYEHFPVEDYMKQLLTPEQWQRVFCRQPKTKLVSLMEIIEAAKKEKGSHE